MAAQEWLLQAWLLQGLLQLEPVQLRVQRWQQLYRPLLEWAPLNVLMGLLLKVCTQGKLACQGLAAGLENT